MSKVIAPKGFSFKVIRHDSYRIMVYLLKGPHNEVGHITLSQEYPGCYATHSTLLPRYRGKGLGALMYAKAIQWGLEHGYRVRSSGSSSQDAQRVWRGKSLRKWFDIRVKKGKDYYTKELRPDYDTFYPHLKKEDIKRKRNGNSRMSRKSR